MTSAHAPARIFTLAQANATLPLIRAIARDIVELSQSMIHTRHRLDVVTRDGPATALYREEVVDIERKLEEDGQRLQRYIDELTQLGVEPKGLAEGLVDFPAMRGDQMVYLCWKYDEPSIEFWHGINDGFAGRQPVDDLFADEDSDESE